jgi:hypothetical protein
MPSDLVLSTREAGLVELAPHRAARAIGCDHLVDVGKLGNSQPRSWQDCTGFLRTTRKCVSALPRSVNWVPGSRAVYFRGVNFCSECGVERLGDSAKFCHNCGKSLAVSEEQVARNLSALPTLVELGAGTPPSFFDFDGAGNEWVLAAVLGRNEVLEVGQWAPVVVEILDEKLFPSIGRKREATLPEPELVRLFGKAQVAHLSLPERLLISLFTYGYLSEEERAEDGGEIVLDWLEGAAADGEDNGRILLARAQVLYGMGEIDQAVSIASAAVDSGFGPAAEWVSFVVRFNFADLRTAVDLYRKGVSLGNLHCLKILKDIEVEPGVFKAWGSGPDREPQLLVFSERPGGLGSFQQ